MGQSRGPWGLTWYQWAVIGAAWMGWGFDIFDALLFNYVAGNCVPTLTGKVLGSPEAREVTALWTGRLTSILLMGWAVGGIFFGWLADRVGRTRTLLFTILLYSAGTALCAVAPNIWLLTLFRVISSLGIGGEWAAGAAMVAEVVPAHKRVEAGALLYTAAPAGLILASLVNETVAGNWLKSTPESSWRYVFLFGLLPALAALAMRLVLKEPETWIRGAQESQPRLAELFSARYRHLTLSGLVTAIIALIGWWSVSAFMPLVASGLASDWAESQSIRGEALETLRQAWKTRATYYFSLGGFIGTLATVPASKYLGRKPMFGLYFTLSALALGMTFGFQMEPTTRLAMFFLIGLSIFGVFGSFTYYLPELFPTRLRATGSGFCYNVGRIITAAGPLLVGIVAQQGHTRAMEVLLYLTLVPICGLLLLPLVVETKGKSLEEEIARPEGAPPSTS